MTAAAITGSFADFKIIRTRGVCQIVVEIDLRNADAALAALGGVPQPESERPVAIARLAEDKPAKPDARERYQQLTEGEQAVARAGVLANDRAFQIWSGAGSKHNEYSHVVWAANYIRAVCKIDSRSELATNAEALARFLDLEARFKTERAFGPLATKGA